MAEEVPAGVGGDIFNAQRWRCSIIRCVTRTMLCRYCLDNSDSGFGSSKSSVSIAMSKAASSIEWMHILLKRIQQNSETDRVGLVSVRF